ASRCPGGCSTTARKSSRSLSKSALMAGRSRFCPSVSNAQNGRRFSHAPAKKMSTARPFAPGQELTIQPGPPEGPLPVGGGGGDRQHRGGLLHGQPGVIAELDELAREGVMAL